MRELPKLRIDGVHDYDEEAQKVVSRLSARLMPRRKRLRVSHLDFPPPLTLRPAHQQAHWRMRISPPVAFLSVDNSDREC